MKKKKRKNKKILLPFLNKSKSLLLALKNKKKNKKNNNEKLELIGDSVLSLIILEVIFINLITLNEDKLTIIKNNIVSNKKITNIIKNRIYLSANLIESIIGIIYLNNGYNDLFNFITNNVKPYFIKKNILEKTSKTILQEKIQKKKKKINYVEIKKTGISNKFFFFNLSFYK